MATFNKIINKVINLDNNIFSLNYDKNDKIQGIFTIFFSILSNIHLYKNYKNKFDYIQKTMNNFYFSKKQNEKTEFFNLFCKIQHIYHTLNKFVYLYKYNKSKLIVNTDLQLNTIKEIDPNIICIYHVNSKYLFKIDELLKLIYTSLTNSFSFFSEPIPIRNPYNNIPFGKSILYYIYYYLSSNTKIKLIKPDHLDIFLKFKECNFNMTKFVNNYEYILSEYYIKNYINNSTKKTIIDDIKEIIKLFNSNFSNNYNKIIISENFPEDDLIRIMKPYLHLSLTSYYSLVQKNKIEARKNLYLKLREFQRFNTQFGRKIIKFKDIVKNGRIKRVKSHIEFNMKHKKFNTYEIDNFMNNHLSYKYDRYDYNESDEEPQFIFSIVRHVSLNTQQNSTTYEHEESTQEDEYEDEDQDEEQDEDDEEEDEDDEDDEDDDDDDEDDEDEEEEYYENDSIS